MAADRTGPVPYGFDEDETVERLLRSAPPRQAWVWVGQILRGTVESVQVLAGTTHAF